MKYHNITGCHESGQTALVYFIYLGSSDKVKQEEIWDGRKEVNIYTASFN